MSRHGAKCILERDTTKVYRLKKVCTAGIPKKLRTLSMEFYFTRTEKCNQKFTNPSVSPVTLVLNIYEQLIYENNLIQILRELVKF